MMMNEIAILGGSFDPIHIGHLIGAQCVYDTGRFREIWVMPTGNPPHKKNSELSKADKLHMCQLAIEGMDGFKVSDIELNREGHVYSVDTFKALSMQYPDIKFWLIIGADSLLQLETWYDYEQLLKIGRFVVVDRGGIDSTITEDELKRLDGTYDASFMYVSMPLIELSSSAIRDRIHKGLTIQHIVPDRVKDYITQHHLYK